jgi:hypothetical protein
MKQLIEIWETYLMRLDADDEAATLAEEPTTEGRPSDVDSKATTAIDEDGARPVSRDEEDRRIAQGADES